MKKILYIFAFAILAYAAHWGLMRFYAPGIALDGFQSYVRSAGFTNLTYDHGVVVNGTYRLTQIALDEEGFHTADKVKIIFSPYSALLGGDSIKKIVIDNLNLLGEYNSERSSVQISGIDSPPRLDSLLPNFAALELKDFGFSFLMPEVGGINAELDLQLSQLQAGNRDFRYSLNSRQKKLSLEATGEGFIAPDGRVNTNLEILGGKLDMEPLRMSRISGNAQLMLSPSFKTDFLSEIRAGSLEFLDLPWQNLTLGFEGDFQNYKAFADMESTGTSGLELSISITKGNDAYSVSGTLFAQQARSLKEYLAIGQYRVDGGIDLNSSAPVEVLFSAEINDISDLNTLFLLINKQDTQRPESGVLQQRALLRLDTKRIHLQN